MSNNNVTLKEKLKEVFKHSIVYGLTSSLQSVLGFIMLPILTVYYTPDIFGVYSILLLLSALSSAIFYLGASTALGRFFFEVDSEKYRKQIISTAIFISIFGAVLLILFGFIFSSKLSLYLFKSTNFEDPILYMLIATAFGFLLNLMTLLLRYEKKSFAFFYIIISGVLINFIITYFLLSIFKFGLLSPIFGLLFSNVSCFFYLIFKKSKSITTQIQIKHVKLMLNFGIQSSIIGLLFYTLDWIDRLILTDLLSLKEVGIYSLGYRLGSIMNIFLIMPFSLVWAPFRMKYASNQNSSILTSKILSYYTLTGVFILLITIFFGQNILQLFFINKDYNESFSILPIIMMSQLFFGYQNIVDYGIYLHKKNYQYIIISVISILINVILNYCLIPKFGILASAFVTLLTYIFSSFSIFILSNRYFSIKIEKIRVLSALIVVPLFNLIFKFYIFNFFYIKIILFISLFIIFYIFWLNKVEKIYIKKYIQRFISF